MWECGSSARRDGALRVTQWALRVRHHGEKRMSAMDLVGLLLLVFLVAPMMTARPSRY
jgi:hypothetical protein